MVNRTPIADDVVVVGWVTENSDTRQIHSADKLLKCSLLIVIILVEIRRTKNHDETLTNFCCRIAERLDNR
jgi:hypothetical protein